MVRIPVLNLEVQIFVCGYIQMPVMSMGSGLIHKGLPLYALLRTDSITSNPHSEGILGHITRSNLLEPTYSERCENGSDDTVLLSIKKVPSTVQTALGRYVKKPSYPEVICARSEAQSVLRVAVFMDMERVKKLYFTVEQGRPFLTSRTEVHKLKASLPDTDASFLKHVLDTWYNNSVADRAERMKKAGQMRFG